MSLARIKATGRGKLFARVTIEGLPIVFVSAKRMETTAADGRIRVCGLSLDGIKIGARADMRRATLEAQGIELKILDLDRVPGSRHGRVTRELWQRPSSTTFLSAEAAPADTTISVYDSTHFPASGVIHIATEAIAYTGNTGTSFTGCTRGHWDTIAQRHFVADGEGLGDARVTDRPQSVEGRRVYLSIYGDGDAPTGDGHARWRGVCSTDLKWDAGTWTVGVDPITRLLAQPVGSDSADEVRIRGIHYGCTFPWVLLVEQPSSGLTAAAHVIGHYETERDFCAAATTAVASALSDAGISLGATGSLTVEPALGGYAIRYTAHSTGAPHELVVTLSPAFVPTSTGESGALGVGTSLEPAQTQSMRPGNSASVTVGVNASFPRGAIGRRACYAPFGFFGSDDSWSRIYLSTYAVPQSGSMLALKTEDAEAILTVSDVDVGTRSVLLVAASIDQRFDDRTSFSVGASVGSGTVIDMLTTMQSTSPDIANSGAMPLLVSDDITWTQDVVDALASSPLCSGRTWVAFDQTTLADLITPELIALGAYMRTTLEGQIEIDMMRPALPTDAAAWSVDDSQMSPTVERGSLGTLGLVRYRYSYNPREDEWGSTLSVRDVQNASATRAPIETTIEQRSTTGSFGATGEFFPGVPPTLETIMRCAVAQFAFFGTDYSTIQTSLDARYMDARIGETVSFSSSLLPDTADGTSAVSSRGVRIVQQSLELATGRVEMELLLHAESFSGYHFGVLIADASLVSGTTYDVTLETGYSEGDATSGLFVGMGVRAVEADSAAPSIVSGTVDSIVSATVVRVAFGSAPSFAGEWALVADVSTLIDSSAPDAQLAHVANAAARIEYQDATRNAKVLS